MGYDFIKVLGLIAYVGAILVAFISYKKFTGSQGSKGLFATGMLGIFLTFTQPVIPVNMIFLLIPILAFSILAIVSGFEERR